LVDVGWDVTSYARISVLEPGPSYIGIFVKDLKLDIRDFGWEKHAGCYS
jgi:hypothetical protein